MRFDAYAALSQLRAEGEGRAIRATGAIPLAPNSMGSMNSTGRGVPAEVSKADPNSMNRMSSTGQTDKTENAVASPPVASGPEKARIVTFPSALSPPPPDSLAAGKVARLPTHPPTCAVCGASDWTVALTNRTGRKLHVSCWKAAGGAS